MLPFDYFDKIVEETSTLSPVYPDRTIGRNLYTIINQNEKQLILCHVPLFLEYPEYSLETAYGISAGAMLAIHHWNNGNGAIVDEINGINDTCDVRFTTEIFNTEQSPAKALRELTSIMSRSLTNDNRQLQPCAILGTEYSSVSVHVATNTGIYDLLQVSPSASSKDLENNEEFPLFARTHPSDGGAGKKIVDYLHSELHVTKLIVLHNGDSFGDAYNQAIQSQAKTKGMNVISIRMDSSNISEESVYTFLEPYSDDQINYFVGIFFYDDYEKIMNAAWRLKLVGPGKLWIHSGAIADDLYYRSKTYSRGSVLAEAIFGNAILTDGGGVPGLKEYDAFIKIWHELGVDETAVDYFNSKQPKSEMFLFNQSQSFFDGPVSHFTMYSYEAVIGMGLSACKAAESGITSQGFTGFSGKQHHDEFLKMKFKSASGDVRIEPNTISRDSNSTYYSLVNLIQRDSTSDKVTIQGVDHVYFDFESGWKRSSSSVDFIYADGTNNQPVFNVEENMNLIPWWTRIFCLCPCILLILMSLGFLIYTVLKRQIRAIKIAQPPFLIMICIGTLLMPIGIITLSMDEGVGLSEQALNHTCTLTPWFLSLGFVVTFSALFSKLWRLNKIIQASNHFRLGVQVSVQDVLIPFIILCSLNVIVLIVWTAVDPIKWERQPLDINGFGEITASAGFCNGNHYLLFTIILVLVNGISIILACHQAYTSKDAHTGLHESKHIGMAFVFTFQSLFFGIPILVATSTSSASLFVITSMVVVVSVAIQLFIFVPIIQNQRATHTLGRERLSLRLRTLRNEQRAQVVISPEQSN